MVKLEINPGDAVLDPEFIASIRKSKSTDSQSWSEDREEPESKQDHDERTRLEEILNAKREKKDKFVFRKTPRAKNLQKMSENH